MSLFKKIQYNAPVVLTFTFLSLAALLLDFATQGKSTQLLFCVYRSSPKDPLTYVRLFGHVLGHASVSHYMSNMMLFLLLGPMIEEKYGSLRMLAMILITALVTGLVNIVCFPNVALLGASGVVFMLIILSSMVRMVDGKLPLTMVLVVVLYLGQEVYNGIAAQDSISQLSHILGGVCGGAFGWLLNRRGPSDGETNNQQTGGGSGRWRAKLAATWENWREKRRTHKQKRQTAREEKKKTQRRVSDQERTDGVRWE